jgi:membrane-associated protease RseP (regulator of RpoE activity)
MQRKTACWIIVAALGAGSNASWGDEPPVGEAVTQKPPAAVIVTDKGPAQQNYDRWITELIDNRFVQVADAALLAANGLGVDLAAPDDALRTQLGLEAGAGLVVASVPAESAGAKAGLQVHDVILTADEQKVDNPARFEERLEAAAGKSVKLRLVRGGKPLTLEVALPKLQVARVDWTPDRWKVEFDNVALATAERYRLGVSLAEADSALRSQLRLAEGEGLVVTEVIEESAAASAGIQTNDVLIVLDGKRLTTIDAINAQVQKIKDRKVELRLLRSGKEMSLQLAPRKTQEAAFIDRPVTFWDTKSCQRCHAQAHTGATAAHLLMGAKLGAHHSAWIGSDGKAHLFGKWIDAAVADSSQSQQQIESLKAQLAHMQQTLAALESSLAAAAPPADKKPTDTPNDLEAKDSEKK